MFVWEYRPQTFAVIPDALVFITLGMNLALGLGFSYSFVSTHFRLSWFIGIIAGVLLSAPLIKHLFKRYFVLLSSFLVTVSGILYTVWPDDEDIVLAARYINGIGAGFIIVPFIVHCSETIVTRKRGYALGLEQLPIGIGICIQVIYIELWTGTLAISPMCLHGIFCLAFGLLALGLSIVVIESPIFFIRQNNDSAALYVLTRLELPAELSDEKKQMLAEHKNYVFSNEFFGLNRSLALGLGPLLRMILYRGILALTFSWPYNIYMDIGRYGMTTTTSEWIIIAPTILRVLGVFGGMTMADPIGRKIISLIGLLAMGGLLVGVAEVDSTDVGCVLLLVMQFFAGLYAPTTTIYLSEAFPLLLKPFFIAVCICLEYAVHIVLIFAFRYNFEAFDAFNITTYALLFASFVLFLFTIPETKLTTLNEAQTRFKAWMHFRSW